MSLYLERENDTICAVATPPGHGGIAVIRVSGIEAVSIAKKFCSFLPKNPESHRVYYGYLKDQNHDQVDEVLCTYFAEERSFTGEPVVEVSCHGGEFLTQQVLSVFLTGGARLAEKGEFSFRAFMNGRIDLVQAESILSLIQSETKKSSQLSLSHLKGQLSEQYQFIEDQLIWILAHLEANIDYAQEDIQVAEETLLLNKLENVEANISSLISSFDNGRKLQDGVRLSLVGLPNAGKSSLLNSILKQERSIVTDIEGTTRDFIEESFFYNNQKFIITDTAGLRNTDDKIEKIGIEKTIDKIKSSDLLVVLIDPTQSIDLQLKSLETFNIKKPNKTLFVINKKDLIDVRSFSEKDLKSFTDHPVIFISAKNSDGIDDLFNQISIISTPTSSESSALVTKVRHFELLKLCLVGVQKAIESLKLQDSPEFTIFELQSSVYNVQEILGKQFDDEVMDRVFKEFCLGK